MRLRFWGTRGSLPVSLTWRDMRERLARALVAGSGRGLDTIEKACAFVERDLDPALSHTFGGHSPCVEFQPGQVEDDAPARAERALEVRLQVGAEGVAALVVEAARRGEHQRIGVGARIEGHGVQNIILE